MQKPSIKNAKLVFSAEAWYKLLYLRDKGNTEVSGWGITAADNPFYVESFEMIKQTGTMATTEFDKEDNTRFVSEKVAEEIYPDRCQKIWIHTHPGNSCSPSSLDETTFAEMMDQIDENDYVMMFIIAKNDSVYCRMGLKHKVGVLKFEIPVSYEELFYSEWDEEYDRCLQKPVYQQPTGSYQSGGYYTNSKTPVTPVIGFSPAGTTGHMFQPKESDPPTQYDWDSATTEDLNDLLDQIEAAPKNQLAEDDMVEQIYAKYMIDSVDRLTNKQLRKLKNKFGNSVEMYLKGLEESFAQGENISLVTLQDIYHKHEVKSFGDLSYATRRELMQLHQARQCAFLKAEKEFKELGYVE
jgi:hypothetical protein